MCWQQVEEKYWETPKKTRNVLYITTMNQWKNKNVKKNKIEP